MLVRTLALFAVVATSGCFYNPQGTVSQPGTTTSGDTTSSSVPTTTADEPACGNGELEPGEQCDDGNAVDGDGCEADCAFTPAELCGNGVIDDGEQCDDGNDVATDSCTNTCKNAVCGDSLVHEGVEACDDGALSPGCDGDCTTVECGDAVVNTEAGEECDDQNADDTDACISCKAAACGDGFVEVGVEECDDGTPQGDDLCNQCENVPYRFVFTTSALFAGDFGNIAVADHTCANTASAADLPFTGNTRWVAWLSANASQAVQRLDDSFAGWYVLPTDPPTLVTRGWSGLTSGSLQHAIDATENGEPVPAPETVWTNSDILGELPAVNVHCKSWASSSALDLGRVGLSTATNSDWTDPANPASAPCSSFHHLYCIEDIL